MINTNLQNHQEFKKVSIETRIHAVIRNKQKQAGDENKEYLSFENGDCYIFGALNIPKLKKYIHEPSSISLDLKFWTYENEIIEINFYNLKKLEKRLKVHNLIYKIDYSDLDDLEKKKEKVDLFDSLDEILKPL